jgi:hypothetical protein
MADSYLIRGKVDTAEELKEKMIDNGDGTYSSGVAVTGSLPAGTNNIGDVDVASIAAGANVIGKVGIDQATPGTTNAVGSTGRTTVSTLINAASIASGASQEFDMGITNETEVWILVNTDKFPWKLRGWAVSVASTGSSTGMFFPIRDGVAAAYSSLSAPATSLYMSMIASTGVGLTTPTTMHEARQFMLPPPVGSLGRIYNDHGADTATVTIRIVRVWR